ncbi:hypothetical protein [Streptomyces sp. NBC_00525]|uniref:hypothetical protein n=1 Tax=Streptomyces sp. NBC_00525 TaxID=2903660 RepID=UPI002E816C37|nr:hypothetical protein [Streptomyces sp. NBC_00525]WUC97415.1 hypothetical protein OG710_29045 [Streptomyces sp. NBC_00525]
MDIYSVCEGLADTLRTHLTLQGGERAVTVFPYVPDSIPEPCVFVAEYEVDYDGAMGRGMDTLTVTIRALVSKADDVSAARAVAALFSGSGAGSLKAALEAGRGGPGEGCFQGTEFADACDDYRVLRMQANRWYQHATATYLGGEITLKVIGSGD